MTAFEFVFALISIITSLALTHLLSGFVRVLRYAGRVRFSAVHLLWAWAAFTVTIGDWASYWGFHALTSWPAWTVLFTVALMIVQYVFCSFVTPEVPEEGEIDLVAFHQREHRRYTLAAIALFALAMVFDLVLGGSNFYAAWWRDSALSLLGAALGLLTLISGAYWVQLSAAALLAAICTYFMIVTCNVVAS